MTAATLNLNVTIDNIPDPATGADGDVMTVQSGAFILAAQSGGGRELLTANRTYYVRTDGNNSNTGLVNSSGGAFLTLQKAYDVITSTLDLGGKDVTIQVADGTYNTTTTDNLLIAQPWTGGGNINLTGNTTTPANCILQTTSASIIHVTAPLPGAFNIRGFKFTTSGGLAIHHYGAGTVNYGTVDFGSVSTGYHIYSGNPAGLVQRSHDYTISGGAGIHWRAENGGAINCLVCTITLTGTPAFATAFCHSHLLGQIQAYSNTYTGSGTGVRYLVDTNSLIYTNGLATTGLPGNSAGSASTGGLYA